MKFTPPWAVWFARSGKCIWVTIGWSNQLAHAVGFPNRLFYCSGLRIALARPRRPRIVTKTDDANRSAPTRDIPDDAEIRALLAALKLPVSEAQEAKEDNAHAKRVAEAIANVKNCRTKHTPKGRGHHTNKRPTLTPVAPRLSLRTGGALPPDTGPDKNQTVIFLQPNRSMRFSDRMCPDEIPLQQSPRRFPPEATLAS